MLRLLCPTLALPIAAACTSSPTESAAGAAPPTTVAAQVERGGEVYAANCARCHGDDGRGTGKAPPVVGPDALPLEPRTDSDRHGEFRTALDVAQFVTANMPPKASARARLSEHDYWAVLAFDLTANGVALDEPVGPANAGSIVLHP